MMYDERSIIDLYKNGLDQNDIVTKCNISRGTVQRIFKEHNISRLDYNKTNILMWYDYYSATRSALKVGEKFNVSHREVYYNFKKLGLPIFESKYTINDNFFESDTPESFYVAGFIAADGNITKNNVRIKLNNKDTEILYKIKKCTDSTSPIKTGKYVTVSGLEREYAVYSVFSEKMVKDLRRFNIVPNKTKFYSFPLWIKDHTLVNHFIRGYFDGDGCAFISGKKFSISFVGTENMMSCVSNIINEKCGLHCRVLSKTVSDGIYNISFGGRIITRKVRDFLYYNSTIHLERKHDLLFSDIIDADLSICKPVIGYNGSEIVFLDAAAHCKKLGFNDRTKITSCCKGNKSEYKSYKWKYATLEEIKQYGAK